MIENEKAARCLNVFLMANNYFSCVESIEKCWKQKFECFCEEDVLGRNNIDWAFGGLKERAA